VHGVLIDATMQDHRPIKTGMLDFRELLICPKSTPGWIMTAISFESLALQKRLREGDAGRSVEVDIIIKA